MAKRWCTRENGSKWKKDRAIIDMAEHGKKMTQS